MQKSGHVGKVLQAGGKGVAGALGLVGEDVQGSAGDVTAEQVLAQRLMINDEAAAQVEEQAAWAHLGELFGTKQPCIPCSTIHVQGDRLGDLEQLVEGLAASRVAQRQLVRYVVEVDAHPDRLGHHR